MALSSTDQKISSFLHIYRLGIARWTFTNSYQIICTLRCLLGKIRFFMAAAEVSLPTQQLFESLSQGCSISQLGSLLGMGSAHYWERDKLTSWLLETMERKMEAATSTCKQILRTWVHDTDGHLWQSAAQLLNIRNQKVTHLSEHEYSVICCKYLCKSCSHFLCPSSSFC